MPPQTNVYVNAPQAKQAKGLMGFLKSRAGPEQRWFGRSTVRALGQTWNGDTRRSARRPVWE